ncbi:MAG: ABC transporter substrate-binding protein, partial [Bacillota bacterium]
EYFDAEPPADDPLSQELYAQMKGKRLPCVDRVEVSIIEESQPRWLAFLNNEIDWINVPAEFLNMAIPRGRLAPWLVKRGVRYVRDIDPDIVYLYFNMRDPIVGGYTPDKIALRRAISLAYDNPAEISLLRNGYGLEAQSPLPPGVLGYDPSFNLGPSHDPAKAKALLDMFGFVDRDGDGWRDMPDGSPLVITYASEPSLINRQFAQLWKQCMTEVGIRMQVDIATWPEHRKQSKLGKLQTWQLSWSADYPDGDNFYQLLYGPNCGTSNDGCFQLPEFDALYEKAASYPPGPERTRIYEDMARIIAAYAPWKLNVHRQRNELIQPWVLGWRKPPFQGELYQYADIDLAARARSTK